MMVMMMARMHCRMCLLLLRRLEMMKIRLFVRVKDIVTGFETYIIIFFFRYLLFFIMWQWFTEE